MSLCECGHPRREHCSCGQHCMHPSKPIYIDAAQAEAIKEMLPELTGSRLEAARRLLGEPSGWEVSCTCTGYRRAA